MAREQGGTCCVYCGREYAHDPPSQWERLVHLHDCMGTPHDLKAGLFHETMGVAITLQAQLARQAPVVAAARAYVQAADAQRFAGWEWRALQAAVRAGMSDE